MLVKPTGTRTHVEGEWRWFSNEMRPFAGYQVAALCLMLLGVAVNAINPLLLKVLIDDVLPHQRTMLLGAITAAFLATYIGSNALSSAGRSINQLGVLRLVFQLRIRLTTHLLALPASFHESRAVGDLLRRVEEDVALVGELGSDVLPSILRVLVQGVVTIVAMAMLDWRLACVVLPVLPASVYVRQRFRAPLRRCAQTVRDASGRQTSLLNELVTSAVQIQALGAERRLTRRYARLNLRSMRARWGQYKTEVLYTVMSMSLVACGVATIVGYGGLRVMSGDLSSGGLIAFYSYLGLIIGPLMMATELYARLERVRASVTRLIEIERAPVDVRDRPGAIDLPSRPERIDCVDVAFSYGPGKSTLSGIDLTVRAGERLVVVGPSGSGKSSLLKLIPRFYDVHEGRVEIDGRDVRDLRLRGLRDLISFVPQEPVLFEGTVRDNIRHGCPGATDDEIDKVLWMTSLTDVIARLPSGLDSEIRRVGSELSGGEKQRLVVARAVLQDRPIVILDEVTSALDPATELRVLERLHPWCRDRIVIVVSHRASALTWADRVVTFGRGGIVSDAGRMTSAAAS